MAVIKKRELRSTFTGPKCRAEHRVGRRHDIYSFRIGGEVCAQTAVSRGRKDLGAPMVSEIAKQVGLTSTQLVALVACTFGTANFEASLVALRAAN